MDTITRILKKSNPQQDFLDGYNITPELPVFYKILRE